MLRVLQSGDLARNIGVSGWRPLTGLAIGRTIGFALGLANGLSRLSRDLTDTTLQMVRNVPHLALIPLVILWFGIDEGAKLFLVALGVFFPIYVNTLLGIQTVPPQLIEMGRTYGMDRRALFLRVILPGALPSIFVGLRYALGIMFQEPRLLPWARAVDNVAGQGRADRARWRLALGSVRRAAAAGGFGAGADWSAEYAGVGRAVGRAGCVDPD